MAYTTSQLEALQKALASGKTRVSFGEMSIEYRSVQELKDAISEVTAGLAQQEAATTGKPRVRQLRAYTRSGF